MPRKDIRRIEMPSADVFLRDYVAKREPVIITNMFRGQEIEQIQTMDDAKRAFGEMKLFAQPEYISGPADAKENKTGVMTFNQYWEHVAKYPASRLLCTEYEIPAKVMKTFRIPLICRSNMWDDREVFDLPKKYGDFDLYSNLFVARQGRVAHLHYDGDHREVLLCQVFGRKGVTLFQPSDGLQLKPFEITPFFSGVYLNKIGDHDKDALLESANGYTATLNPGEVIYIPMLTWHFLDYIDDAMSFNVRFKRNSINRFLCVDHFHRDYYIQNFSCHLNNRTTFEYVNEAALPSIMREYSSREVSLQDKVKRMRSLIKELCKDICPDAKVDDYCPAEEEDRHIEMIIRDIGSSARYAEVEIARKGRLDGAVSGAQLVRLKEMTRSMGYSSADLETILSNRLGKHELSELTKAEAAQFVTYLSAPGASLL